jgi:hypothetical protein
MDTREALRILHNNGDIPGIGSVAGAWAYLVGAPNLDGRIEADDPLVENTLKTVFRGVAKLPNAHAVLSGLGWTVGGGAGFVGSSTSETRLWSKAIIALAREIENKRIEENAKSAPKDVEDSDDLNAIGDWLLEIESDLISDEMTQPHRGLSLGRTAGEVQRYLLEQDLGYGTEMLLGERLGDVLATVLMIARHEGIDVRVALRGAIRKMKSSDINRK